MATPGNIKNMSTSAEQMYMKWSRKKLRISKKQKGSSGKNSSSASFTTFAPKTTPRTPRFRNRQNDTSSSKRTKKSHIDGKVERMIRSAEVETNNVASVVGGLLIYLL